MSGSKHTPGPWLAQPKCDLDSWIANARLIAAAPDLLEALKVVEFDVRGRCSACFGWDGESENDHKHSPICIVATAIAKATAP
jgi:hypothetical protein